VLRVITTGVASS